MESIFHDFMDFINYDQVNQAKQVDLADQAAAVASLEQLLSDPCLVDYSSPDDSENVLLLNNSSNNNAIPITSVPQSVHFTPHTYHYSQRQQYLKSTFDVTNNTRAPFKADKIRQDDYFYPGLEQYDGNQNYLFLEFDEPLDFTEKMTEEMTKFEYADFPLAEEQVSSLLSVPEQLPSLLSVPEQDFCLPSVPEQVFCLPVPEQIYIDKEDVEEEESDNEEDCDDDEYTPATNTFLPTPSTSPPPHTSPPALPHTHTTPQKPKIPRSRAKKGEKRIHVCLECNRQFTRACNLQSHVLTHLNLKPYPCTECDKTFARVYDMHRHKRIHSDAMKDKPYKCPDCPMRFKRTEPRHRHLESVHGLTRPHKH
ncbi:hypothetical protein EC991_001824 [Linnemannia zychae]|nr:hypothetical protein EC991_001824 [Linnemannia zychae]